MSKELSPSEILLEEAKQMAKAVTDSCTVIADPDNQNSDLCWYLIEPWVNAEAVAKSSLETEIAAENGFHGPQTPDEAWEWYKYHQDKLDKMMARGEITFILRLIAGENELFTTFVDLLLNRLNLKANMIKNEMEQFSVTSADEKVELKRFVCDIEFSTKRQKTAPSRS